MINGLGGDDLIRPGVGADTIFAGAGSDTVSYVDALQGVRVSLVTGLGELGTAQGDKIDGIENIVGSAFADTLTGDSLANQLTGGAGDDTLTAGGGNDTVIGGDGKDLATLGAGDDLFPWTFTDDSDAIDGQDGFDRLSFGVSASAEIISLAGNAGQVRLTRDVGSNLLGLTSMELIELRTSGGADQVHVGNMEGTGLQQVLIDLELGGPSSAGDQQADTITLDGTAAANSITVKLTSGDIIVGGLSTSVKIDDAEASDRFVFEAGTGDDTIDASTMTAGAELLLLHGGLGDTP